VKVLLADVMVHPVDTTLQDGKTALDRVRSDAESIFVTDIFFRRVIDVRVIPLSEKSLFRR
jgi:hypothetical protein